MWTGPAELLPVGHIVRRQPQRTRHEARAEGSDAPRTSWLTCARFPQHVAALDHDIGEGDRAFVRLG